MVGGSVCAKGEHEIPDWVAEDYWVDPREREKFDPPRWPVRQEDFDLTLELELLYPKIRGVETTRLDVHCGEWRPPRDLGSQAGGYWDWRRGEMRGYFNTRSMWFGCNLAQALHGGRELGIVSRGEKTGRGKMVIRELRWLEARDPRFIDELPPKFASALLGRGNDETTGDVSAAGLGVGSWRPGIDDA